MIMLSFIRSPVFVRNDFTVFQQTLYGQQQGVLWIYACLTARMQPVFPYLYVSFF